MLISRFDYVLPKELIAQYPLKERDRARLMVIDRKRGDIRHAVFKDLPGYFSGNDLVVLNDSRVLACRLIGRRISGGKVEILLLERKKDLTFNALLKPSRLRPEEKIIFNNGNLSCRITGRQEVTFSDIDIAAIYRQGLMPLPPYIKRLPQAQDFQDYQTVYAQTDGSIAAPTAGLHFTRELLNDLRKGLINTAYLTLHVGLGTFKPVRAEDITGHKMEAEYFSIPQATIEAFKEAHQRKGRIIAVGTTSLRALETSARGRRQGSTDLFIYPGYKFQIVDCLLTNFHLPKTTLFMLVCAFCGEALTKRAYQIAIEQKYRFYSYGDAMLII